MKHGLLKNNSQGRIVGPSDNHGVGLSLNRFNLCGTRFFSIHPFTLDTLKHNVCV